VISNVITNLNFKERSPIAQLNRSYSLSPRVVGLARPSSSESIAERGLSTLLITPGAQWFLPAKARGVLTVVPDSPEPLAVGSLSALCEAQVLTSLEEYHPDLAGGVEGLSIVIATWSCYQTVKDGTSVVRKVFCTVDVLMGILEMLKWLPGIKEIAENLTIVHVSWSVAGKVVDHVFKASDKRGKSLIATVSSKPGAIQGVTFRV
jgi:hypothetical protein